MKLVITDLVPTLDARMAAKVQAMCRNVRVTRDGYLRRGKRRDQWPADDWRAPYRRALKHVFPNAWIYRGGHHLAVHASPPPAFAPEAGPCLFRICESANAVNVVH